MTTGGTYAAAAPGFNAGEDLTRYTCFSVRLSSGRRLTWSEFGHRHGYPVLYMHRQGGCRLEAGLLHEAAKVAGFRLISVDCPGLGGSDFFAFERPDALVEDYHQLLNYLGLPQVAVLSLSGGCRFALALATSLPDRVSFLNLVSPLERSCALTKIRWAEIPVKMALRLVIAIRTWRAAGDSTRYIRRWREQMCYADRKQFDDPVVMSLLTGMARESTRRGTAGLAQDIWLSMAAHGSDAAILPESPELKMPVHIWHRSEEVAGYQQVGNTNSAVSRHRIRQQGQLFFRQAADDIHACTDCRQ
ncbi:MAG: alpha/beta hydrolase, partial [Gammaproteobacteria bacterium]|nr:alpha/beta hydrolase [Gammaproteobacteria bacterium]